MAPKQKPGLSQQDYCTPADLISAVKHLLEIEAFTIDLAADHTNAQAISYITKESDSLSLDWLDYVPTFGWAWLNPPFGHIAPWAQQCAHYGGGRLKIAFLVPAAVGANWWRLWVEPFSYQLHLNGRPSFDGVGPYPKDLSLVLYGTPFRGSVSWDWRSYVG